MDARAFDANLSSETASADFTVSNPEPGTSIGNSQWCLPTAVIAMIAGISAIILLSKKKR